MPTNLGVFRCLKCDEFINATAERCRFCSALVDRKAAESASDMQAKANEAYSEANHLRWIVIGTLSFYVFLSLRLIVDNSDPQRDILITKQAALAVLAPAILCLLALSVLISLIIRWRLKYAYLQTDNPDMIEAKKIAHTTLIAWCIMCVTWVCLGLAPVILGYLRYTD